MGGVPLVKGDQGIWEVVIGPIKPGLYRYTFIVDGVSTTDPRNPLTSRSLTHSSSLYEVPGKSEAAFTETITFTNPTLHSTEMTVVPGDDAVYQQAFKSLFALFVLSLLLESGLAVIFRWRRFSSTSMAAVSRPQ